MLQTKLSFSRRPYKGEARIVYDTVTGRYSVMTVDAKGETQFPVRYQDGRIAYDFPERVPEYLKRLCRRAFNTLYEKQL